MIDRCNIHFAVNRFLNGVQIKFFHQYRDLPNIVIIFDWSNYIHTIFSMKYAENRKVEIILILTYIKQYIFGILPAEQITHYDLTSSSLNKQFDQKVYIL